MKGMKKLMLGGLAVGGLAALAVATRRKDTVSIVLKENLTEGYLWMYTMEHQGIIEEYSTNYVPAFGEGEKKESFGKHKWTFAPLRAGETFVHFSYIRPWKSEEPALANAIYRFRVDEDKKITVELLEHSKSFNAYVLSVG